MAVLLDTGVLYALADRRDSWHRRVLAYFGDADEALLVPVTVIPEVSYLLHTRLGPAAEQAFVRSLAARELDVEMLRDQDVARTAAVLERYPDIGFVDASVVVMAERLKVTQIATTDRRHFARVKPRHTDAFVLLP
jgi:predicted nucleic acid-binding protein